MAYTTTHLLNDPIDEGIRRVASAVRLKPDATADATADARR
jgi:hypothetical protein